MRVCFCACAYVLLRTYSCVPFYSAHVLSYLVRTYQALFSYVHTYLPCSTSSLPLQIQTATDRSTNSLVSIRLEATLPRLSCNVHSSAFLLLSRLLKNGEYIVQAGTVQGTHHTNKNERHGSIIVFAWTRLDLVHTSSFGLARPLSCDQPEPLTQGYYLRGRDSRQAFSHPGDALLSSPVFRPIGYRRKVIREALYWS